MSHLIDSSFDKIRDFILGRTEALPEHLMLAQHRWTSAFTLLGDNHFRSDRFVAKELMHVYGISEITAYADIAASKRMFGDARKSYKDAERYLASENAKELYGKAWSMFLATKKYQWFVAAVSQQKLHARVNGLDRDDPDLPDPSKINPPTQILQINIEYITSQFAQHIDPKAKHKLNELLAKIDDLVQSSRIGDYLDTTIEIPRIKE
jgi:hypothetical protein